MKGMKNSLKVLLDTGIVLSVMLIETSSRMRFDERVLIESRIRWQRQTKAPDALWEGIRFWH